MQYQIGIYQHLTEIETAADTDQTFGIWNLCSQEHDALIRSIRRKQYNVHRREGKKKKNRQMRDEVLNDERSNNMNTNNKQTAQKRRTVAVAFPILILVIKRIFIVFQKRRNVYRFC